MGDFGLGGRLPLLRPETLSNGTYDVSECTLGRDSTIAIVFLAAAYLGTYVILNAFAVPGPVGNAQTQF